MSPQTRKTDNFLPPRSSYTNKYETISIWKQKVLFLHRLLPDNFLVFLRPHSWIWPYLTFTVVQLNSWVDKKIGWQTNVFSFLYINAFFSSETQKIMPLIIYFKNGMNKCNFMWKQTNPICKFIIRSSQVISSSIIQIKQYNLCLGFDHDHHTGCPNKNCAVACCYSRATAQFLLGHPACMGC